MKVLASHIIRILIRLYCNFVTLVDMLAQVPSVLKQVSLRVSALLAHSHIDTYYRIFLF